MKKKTRKTKNNSYKSDCEICKKPYVLETHHIHGRKIHNFDADWNLVDICPNCHTSVHKNKIIIYGWISTTDGRELDYINTTITV